MSAVATAASGDRRAALQSARDALAAAIDAAEPRELAPLVKQFRETLAELESLGAAREVSASDDLAAKRKARRAAAPAARAPRRRASK